METLVEELLQKLKPALRNQRKARQILERYWSDRIALVWTVADLHRAANERSIVLRDQEAVEILEDLFLQYNRQVGLKWIELWDAVEMGTFGRKITKQELRRFLNDDQVAVERRRR